MMDFTNEQKQAIYTRGTNLIVSAGAGSGKTAVLSERILQMLCDGYDISRLLVLTFTNAAALEMKTRIKKKVSKVPSLSEQVSKIDSAYITTFDAFALSLVKKYHYLLGISKDLTIADSVVMKLKKEEIINEIFTKHYTKETLEFLDLLNKFTFKDDNEFKDSILKIAEKIELKPNKEKFLYSYLDNYYRDENIDSYVKIYVEECNERLKDFKLSADDLYTSIPDSKLGEFLSEFLDFIKLEHSYEEIVAYFSTLKIPSAPRGDEESQESRKKFKDDVDKFASDFLKFDNLEVIKESLMQTKSYVSVIINILLDIVTEVRFWFE